MKTSISLFSVFVCYIANTEEEAQVAVPQCNYIIPRVYYIQDLGSSYYSCPHQRDSHPQLANSVKKNENTNSQFNVLTNIREMMEKRASKNCLDIKSKDNYIKAQHYMIQLAIVHLIHSYKRTLQN